MLANLAGTDAALILIVLVCIVGGFTVFVWGLVDSISRPAQAYNQARSNKALWIALIVLLGVIGSALYLLVTRPKLIAAQNSRRTYPAGWPTDPPAGWFPDPTQRHEMRYWDGRLWTAEVSTNGRMSSDPIRPS